MPDSPPASGGRSDRNSLRTAAPDNLRGRSEPATSNVLGPGLVICAASPRVCVHVQRLCLRSSVYLSSQQSYIRRIMVAGVSYSSPELPSHQCPDKSDPPFPAFATFSVILVIHVGSVLQHRAILVILRFRHNIPLCMAIHFLGSSDRTRILSLAPRATMVNHLSSSLSILLRGPRVHCPCRDRRGNHTTSKHLSTVRIARRLPATRPRRRPEVTSAS